MPELIDKQASMRAICDGCFKSRAVDIELKCRGTCNVIDILQQQPIIEAEPVRRGHWIECDYKHLEHGFMETEPNAGLCCSSCRTAFQKKKMTYKQYCAACGAKMGGADNEQT
jgi:hypothetical protein